DSERMKEEFLDSLDLFETLENKDLRLALAKTPKNKEFSNMRKIDILEKFGLIVMAVEKKNNRFQVQVPFNKKIGAGTKVIVLGTDLQLKIFEKSEKRS
ncbi:hypothetical protein JXB11_01675, partial [Candidatus Woesearchaeota archaeon]|nr:hypothetical protein [Candidatus Woesearchaeota archaeon]